AKRARKRQKNRTHDARARVGNHDVPRRFPFGGAQGKRRFALIRWNGVQNFTRNGDDERGHHYGENDSGRQETDAVERSLKQRQKPEGGRQERSEIGVNQRNQDENAEQTVNDAWHRG